MDRDLWSRLAARDDGLFRLRRVTTVAVLAALAAVVGLSAAVAGTVPGRSSGGSSTQPGGSQPRGLSPSSAPGQSGSTSPTPVATSGGS